MIDIPIINRKELESFVNERWQKSIVPTLMEYIRIPNKSPAFDSDWEKNGHMQRAINLVSQWCQQQGLKNMSLQIHQTPGRTPILLLDLAGHSNKTVLLYGHLDKQPEMTDWEEGLGPWQPVLKQDRLYGRGSADDGYAVFAALTAIAGLQRQNLPHARCLILIECCEESGSHDLSFYISELKVQLGIPDLVICLDSGCGNYEQLWCTTSLRGVIGGILTVKILEEGIHSGVASGIVPSTFRIMRQLLNRIEDEQTGKMLIPELAVNIPPEYLTAASDVAEILGDKIWQELPFIAHAQPTTQNCQELILNNTWRAALSVTGIEGVPSFANAGNVLRPQTAVKLSIRTPPDCELDPAARALKKILEENPPYQAEVKFDVQETAAGWHNPPMQPWLFNAINEASFHYFGKMSCYFGEGGTIPFLGMLSAQFPNAQFMVTGVLGPKANAHGPNEFLHIPTAKQITCCVAEILYQHATQIGVI